MLSRAFFGSLLMAMTIVLAGCSGVAPDELIARAEQSLNNKEYRAAVLDLKEVLREDPENARARRLLGEVYLAVEDGASAEKELRRAGGQDTDEELAPLLVYSLLLQGKFDQVGSYTPDASLSPAAMTEIRAFQALALIEQDDLDGAEALLAANDPARGVTEFPYYAKARLLKQQQRYEQSMQAVQAINARSPDFALAWALRGDLLGRERKFEQAEQSYTQAIAHRVMNRRELIKRGFARLLLGRVDEADADAEKALALGQKFQPAHYLAGIAAFQKGTMDSALDSLERSLALSPEHFPTVVMLALASAREGNINRALQMAEQAVTMQPGFPLSRLLLARLYLSQGRGADAESLIRPVVTARPNDLEAKGLLAGALMQQHKWRQAAPVLRQLADANQDSARAQLVAGVGAIAAGDVDRGVATLEQAAEGAPDDPMLNTALVASLIGGGSHEDALAVSRAYVTGRPDDPLALNLLAAAQLAAKDKATAIATYQRILTLDPGNLQATHVLAVLLLGDGKNDEASGLVAAGLARHPDDLPLLLMQAQVAEQAGDLDAAVMALQQAIDAHPMDPAPRARMAAQLLRQGQSQQALAVLNATGVAPDEALLASRGKVYFALGRFTDAVNDFAELARRAPESIAVQRSLALAYENQGDLSGVERALDRILGLDPSDVDALLAKVRLLVVRGDTAAAASLLSRPPLAQDSPDVQAAKLSLARRTGDHATEITLARTFFQQQPSTVNAVTLSRAYQRADDLASAERVLGEWLGANPDDATAYVELANLQMAAGHTDASIATLERLIERDPENTFALNNLAWHLREKSPTRALQYALKAAEREPDSTAVLDTLALAYASTGDYAKALRAINRAIDIDPKNLDYRLRRTELLEISGDVVKATAELRVLLDGRPSPAFEAKVRERLSRLEQHGDGQ